METERRSRQCQTLGYHFVDWSDGSTANPRTDTNVTANVTVTANFAINTYTLTVTQPASGTIAPTTATYDYGTVVELTATPATGYHFVEWTGACTGSGACSVTMDDEQERQRHVCDQHLYSDGDPAGGRHDRSDTATYDYGTVVELTATPATGYHFVEWTGACTGSGACSVTMDDNKSVSATFAINTYHPDGDPAGGRHDRSDQRRPTTTGRWWS